MSSAFFPLGMNHNINQQQAYRPWKGTNPTGSAPGTIRPLTNNDPTNNSSNGFGLPRPIKHARLGRDFSTEHNRLNKSSGTGHLVKQMIDIPGGFTVAQNAINTGVGINTVSYNFLNLNYKSEKPPVGGVTSQPPCYKDDGVSSFTFCSPERNARRRTMSGTTNLNKKYYTRLEEYREARCKTFSQNESHFKNYDNFENNEVGCPCVVYKPNNAKFSKQGAVSSSTRLMDLNVKTINKHAASLKTGMNKNKFVQCVDPNWVHGS